MLCVLALASVPLRQELADLPRLEVGKTLEGEMMDSDPRVETPTLKASYTDAPVVGKSYLIEIDGPGPFTLDLRSYFFDAYLVLRDEAGTVLSEDDDGGIGTHARITTELEPGAAYRLETCALNGNRGPFELRLEQGKPPALSPAEERTADRADLERTVAVRETVLGPEHPDTASSLYQLALYLKAQGDYAGAWPYAERALAIDERALGPEHPDTATCLDFLASLLRAQGKYAAALPYCERALAIYEKALGPEHLDTATCLNNLANLLKAQGEYVAARPYCERALAIREKQLGPEHPDTAKSLDSLASLLRGLGDYAAARPLFERALAIREKKLGPEHSETAISLNNLALLLQDQGDYAAAQPYLERALAIDEKTLGPEHRNTATDLNNLALLLQGRGDYAAARPLFERALAIREKVLGPEHPDTASSFNNLAVLLMDQGDYTAARSCYERALAIWEKTLGPEHPVTASVLDNLAQLFRTQGDYVAARLDFERALAIREKQLGPEHTSTARSLNSLATLLEAQGDYAAARPLFERALAIREKQLGPEHLDTATSLNNLAALLQAQGDFTAARPYYERALAIREEQLGPEHPDTATTLNNLALLLEAQGDYAAARPYFERALAIREKQLGPEHPDTATILNNLALLLEAQGDYAAARPYLERALAIVEKAFGPEHPDTARSLGCLANLLRTQGDSAAARPLFERALAVREKALGPEHPNTAKSRYNLSIVLADAGVGSESHDLARQALTSSLVHAESTLWSLSEKERMLFLKEGDQYLRLVLSLAAWSEPTRTESAAYELSLAWRGLASRTLIESRAQLTASLPEAAAAAIENLHGVQAQLSKVLYATEIPDRERHEREIRELRDRRNELEVELQRLIGPTRERSVTLSELQGSLQPGSAFLDFLVHPLYQPAKREGAGVVGKGEWSADHVSAWVVRPDREVAHVDLGPAAEIESAVKGWLGEVVGDRMLVAARGIGSSEGIPAAPGGQKLRTLLWSPLAEELDGIQRVFVRADSFLGTLPFEVIPLEDGEFLIEEMSFVYVQTPLDLIGTAALPAAGPPTLFAAGDVDFQSRGEAADDRPKSEPVVASADIRGARQRGWPGLPFTGQEAEAVERLHEASFGESSRLLLEERAVTEERLKQELPRYSVLHLATHGFFNPAGTVSMWESAQEAAERPELAGLENETRALVGALPGLLTGLVCAGANEPARAGRDDGLLTAEEVLWLDLSHVDLVVLSACETALGERRAGEGMIGLRRAFGLAGARTVVSSLWSVKDRSTSVLMEHFYENLWQKKQGRAEALREAQLEMLARNRASGGDTLPSTWGAFVLSGEWR